MRYKLNLLEVGRGLAALAVCAHHAELSANAFTVSKSHYGLFSWGILGVDFFFVLSGFIIYYAHHSDEKTLDGAVGFYGKRIKRIYIPYIPVSIALVASYMALPQLSQGSRDWSLITSLTLFPTDGTPALSVAWTLTFEMIFYTAFLMFYLTRRFLSALLVWSGTVLAILMFNVETGGLPSAVQIALHPLVLEFIGGVFCAHLFLTSNSRNITGPAAVGLLGCVAFFLLDAHRIIFGLSLAFLVLAASRLESEFHIQVPKTILYLGASSYAVYLVHNPAQSLIVRATAGLGSWVVSFVACFLIGALLGMVYHSTYEKPILGWLKARRVSLRRSGIPEQLRHD